MDKSVEHIDSTNSNGGQVVRGSASHVQEPHVERSAQGHQEGFDGSYHCVVTLSGV